MKKAELIFTGILVPVDFLMLVLAGLAAYFLRTSDWVVAWRPVLFSLNLPFERYLGIVVMVALVWLVVFAFAGLYKMQNGLKGLSRFLRIVIACSAALMTVIIYIFVRREFFDSRFIVLSAWIFAIFFVYIGRFIVGRLQKFSMSHWGIGAHKVLVIGSDSVAQNIIEEIKVEPTLGYRLVKNSSEIDMEEIIELEKIGLDDVILANPEFPREKVLELIDFCEEKHLNFKFVPNLFQTLTTNVEYDTLAAAPLIELKHTALDGWGRILKRVIDIIGAVFGLVIFSPIMLILAVLIKLDSRGPVIYKNERVGPKGVFNTYKLRSFKREYCTGRQYDQSGQASRLEDDLAACRSGRQGPVFKILNDPRRTRVGRFLEKSSLDELPQFYNVLLGNMSLVGPRPHMPKEVAKYERWHKKVFNIKPGVTGLAQISGRSDINFDEEAKLDIYYLENWSFLLDLKILFKTPLVVLIGKHK